MRKIVLAVLLLATIMACGKTNANQELMTQEAAQHKGNFSNVPFAIDFDPVCQMSLTSGISDTAHLSGKIYGFCAGSCKTKFESNPSAYSK